MLLLDFKLMLVLMVFLENLMELLTATNGHTIKMVSEGSTEDYQLVWHIYSYIEVSILEQLT